MLELTPLSHALQRLERAIVRSKKEPEDKEVRDAVIQRFEYSYELCWKIITRQLEMDSATPAGFDGMSFKDLFREAAVKGLVDNPEDWFEYRRKRNITSHTYDEKKAEEVYEAALDFFP